jgi:predicted MPP superfamily phosphohydrolase
MNKLIIVPVFGLILLLIDWYVFQAIRVIGQDIPEFWRRILYNGYWLITGIVLTGYLIYHFANPDLYPKFFRTFLMVGIFIHYFAKTFAVVFLLIDDVIRAGQWVVSLFNKKETIDSAGDAGRIPRSEFLVKTALIAGTLPLAAMTYGIISGAHDYRIRRKKILLRDLPKALDGLKIAQISDIHSGSFFNRTAVKGGVDMLMKEKPDVVFFTGDLVNSETGEVKNYINIFDKVKAPLGVYSTTGNHDYGDYRSWSSAEAKQENFRDLVKAHKLLGWDILMNENRILTVDGEKIGIIGVENWGAGRFSKYGDLDKAYSGSDQTALKLLLSHDPSHWDAQVRQKYPDINVTFSGHTHGFQFGVEWGDFRWSPSQYIYKQWAGLYQEGDQFLYVNRGYGYLGYPGRIGIPPEITIIELLKAA